MDTSQDCYEQIMKLVYLFIWFVAGIVTMALTLFNLAEGNWPKATFFLVATLYADVSFYRFYNEIKTGSNRG